MLMIKSKTFQSIKVAFATLMLCTFVIVCCSSKNISKTPGIRKVVLIYNLQMVTPDGQLRNVNDSFFIFYLDDDILYQFPHIFTEENDDSITSKIIKANYFIHRKGGQYGYFYDSANAAGFKVMFVDSLLKKKAFFGNDYYDKKTDSLVETVEDKHYPLVEKYIPTTKPDLSYTDTTIFYYTNGLKNIDYSLSRQLDSIKKFKLKMVKLIYNTQYYEGYSFKVPRRVLHFELREDSIFATNAADSVFNRFKREWEKRSVQK